MFRQRVNISEAPEQCQSSTVLQLAGKSSAVVHAPITALVFTVHVSLIVGGDASPSQLFPEQSYDSSKSKKKEENF